jgi:LacI family transcriptional regulator
MKPSRVTREDVAARAGVSTAVVSYVLNNGPRPVAPETRARVEAAIEELGYYPNELARGLRMQQTCTVGLIIPNLNNPAYAQIATSLKSVCLEHGYLVLLCNTGRDQMLEKRFVQMLRAKQVDGVVIIPSHDPQEAVGLLAEAHIPSVVLEHDLPGSHCIVVDDLVGGRLATQHLLDLGHRRIGFIRYTAFTTISGLRLDGYRQSLAAAGIEVDPALLIECDDSYAAGCEAMDRLLTVADPPTAVFTHNDVLALGAMHAVQRRGLAIPDDISIVGYDDTASSAYFNPPLTTVRLPTDEIGREAAIMILDLAQRERDLLPPQRTTTLPVQLIVRGSTASPVSAMAVTAHLRLP